jgi:NADH:ubiquinone oxidoreductase subunit K
MMIIAVIIGAIGLVAILSKRNLLSISVGVQLIFLGSTFGFVAAGTSADRVADTTIFAVFIIFSGVLQTVVGYALSVRFFQHKKTLNSDDLNQLRN